MPKRRTRGEGTITRYVRGGYRGAVTLGRDPATGKLKRVWFYGETKAEVAAKIAKAQHELQTGTFVEPTRVTVGQ